LRDSAVDAVVITLPRRLTAAMAEACLEHEKWVFTEKPLFLNSASAPRILSRVAAKGLCVGFMKRCDSGVGRSKLMIDEERHRLGALESVIAICHAGDSYFGIGGDLKSTQERVLLSDQEELPSSVPAALHYSYEQFLNVYSHTLNLSEYLAGAHVALESCVYAESGAGHFIGRIGRAPYLLSVSRGQKHPWTESVELRFEKAIITTKLPAAFDKKAHAVVEYCATPDIKLQLKAPSNELWAFDAQPQRFREVIDGRLSPVEDILSSWRYAENCEHIFSSKPPEPS
jgi:predicted dehydrogenase